MPNMMGGLSQTTYGFQGSGPEVTFWVPPAQLGWERVPSVYDPNDDLVAGAFEYIEEPTLATDAFYGRPYGLRGENQMQQLLAT